MRWKEIHKELDHLEQCAGIAINAETKEPLYYYMVNEIEFIRDATTPFLVRILRAIERAYIDIRIRLGIDSFDDHIPF